MAQETPTFKLVLVGDGGTGKVRLILLPVDGALDCDSFDADCGVANGRLQDPTVADTMFPRPPLSNAT